ncbi:carnitine monooxygenase subunit YeaW [Paralimibaculum aggregatum]|uniref:Carnitine monooxygenase subunit YeaW n=1 Tax=Paralimibaculum aggregatum TaxID=3036245 RepID=A0ABQ6LFD0_9RHOB|nr:ring-hydroxylating oxygenase subunit alpha [Limibaculum sp. NKW23]GMG81702.1 carnitine monooxygenase subunit YeaW [Limibaculum sp. NKW23]
MTEQITAQRLAEIRAGYHADPARSHSLRAEAYTDPAWYAHEARTIFARSWQWVCHVEKLRAPGSYIAIEVAGRPVIVLRDREGELRAFYNVCKHRAHELLRGEGQTTRIMCPYHAWVYDLTGRLRRAPETESLHDFMPGEICLDAVQVEAFCSFVYVNLDPEAPPLAEISGDLGTEIRHWAPDLDRLTFAHRLTYDIRSNWKNVVDNFLECYHCPTAHKDFCTLVDMDTYRVTTHGIYSSHMAEAGKGANTAYATDNATVKDHAVWWLWPNTCLMRYPGRGNFIVMHIIPVGPDRTLETYDFFFETAEKLPAETEAIRYIDEVLQAEDIALVESVQRGMNTPAFTQGRIVHDPDGSGKSEHAVHHFHGLVLDAYARAGA